MKVIVNNIALEYSDEGNGPVLLLLHGWQDSLATFASLVDNLGKDYRIVRLDLPGFGKSELPKTAWDLSDYINLVQNFITKLNLSVNVVIGHSFGGRITIKGTATKLLSAQKIVLIGSAGIAKTKTARTSLTRLITRLGSLIMYIPPLLFWRKRLRKKLYEMIGSDYLNAGPLQETFLKIINEDLSTYAATISLPTLLIWGAKDTATPLSDGQKLNHLIRQSQLEVFPDASHFVHQEQAQAVAQIIKAFVN